jgi:hypothetical protein
VTAVQLFKKNVKAAFLKAGFVESSAGLCCEASDVTTVVGFEHGFGRQWYVAVGFVLRRICESSPSAPHSAHIYLRLERLFPKLRELIQLSGDLDDPGQSEALSGLCERIPDLVAPRLRELTNESSLALALRRGELRLGLVTKEAREYLEHLPTTH